MCIIGGVMANNDDNEIPMTMKWKSVMANQTILMCGRRSQKRNDDNEGEKWYYWNEMILMTIDINDNIIDMTRSNDGKWQA